MTETPEATGVTVSGDGVANGALSLKKGTTAQLTAKVAPDDADQAVTWASSDDKVVTVDKTGKVTAVAKGVAKVTATTANGKSASVTVTVTEDAKTHRLVAAVSYSDGEGGEEGILFRNTYRPGDVVVELAARKSLTGRG